MLGDVKYEAFQLNEPALVLVQIYDQVKTVLLLPIPQIALKVKGPFGLLLELTI